MLIMYRKTNGMETAHICANRNRYITTQLIASIVRKEPRPAPLVACRAALTRRNRYEKRPAAISQPVAIEMEIRYLPVTTGTE